MKKMLVLPLLLGMAVASGQVKFGAKAGVNVSTFKGLDSAESLTAYHFGGFVRWKFNHLALQPEVLYSAQGATVKENGTDKDYKLDYVLVPVMLQWQFGGSFYVEGGFQAGFRTSDNLTNNVSSKGTDWSGALGLGFMKPTGGFGLGARYSLGLSNTGNAGSDDFKNGVAQFSLLYLFK